MSEETKPATKVAKRTPGFQEGHQRFGGKKKNTAAAARAMAAEMGIDPLEFMLSIINSDTIEQTVIVDGKKKRVEVAIPLDMRLDAAKTVVNYMYPRLTAQQISGPSEGPIEVAGLDITKLLQDPAMVEMAQSLAIAMAHADSRPRPAQICGPADSQAQPAGYDPLEPAARDENGHYLPK